MPRRCHSLLPRFGKSTCDECESGRLKSHLSTLSALSARAALYPMPHAPLPRPAPTPPRAAPRPLPGGDAIQTKAKSGGSTCDGLPGRVSR